MRMMAVGAGFVILAVSGCEPFSFTETTDVEDEYIALQNETLSIRSELDQLDVTAISDIPLTGSATYKGTALIALDTPARSSELIGNASVTADFATNAVTGQMTGFRGTIDDGDVMAYDGNLTISRGVIDVNDPQMIDARVDGTLVGDGDVLAIAATLAGDFYGDPIFLDEAPEGIALESTAESVFTLNGDAVSGGMEVIGLD